MVLMKIKRKEKKQLRIRKGLVFILTLVMFATLVATPQQTYAFTKKAKKSKVKYSITVRNISSNTVLKKGKKLRISYIATQTIKGKTSKAKVKFRSSNKKVATVSKKGIIKAKKKGTVKITVYCKKNPKKKKTVKIRVGTPVTSISISGSNHLRKGRSSTFGVSVNKGATNKKISWWSDNTAVATVNSSGKVTTKAVGTATIYAKAKDGSGVTGSRKVYVHGFGDNDTKWIAHRGLHTKYTENSAEAFRAAASSPGFWGIECDIWETKHIASGKEPLPDKPVDMEEPEESGNIGDDSVETSDSTQDTKGEEASDESPQISVENEPGDSSQNIDKEEVSNESDQASDDVSNAITELVITDPYALNLLDRDKANAIKTVKASYDALDALQKYKVRSSLGDVTLDNFFTALVNISEYESFAIIINHDSSYKRIFGDSSMVWDLTINDINARSKLKGKVCMFDEYVSICYDAGKVPVVEMKRDAGSGHFITEMAVKKMVDTIYETGGIDLVRDTYFISFDAGSLTRTMNYIYEKYGLGADEFKTYYVLSSNAEAGADIAKKEGFTGISVSKGLLNDSLQKRVNSYGLGLGTWTYKDTLEDDGNLYLHVLSGRYKLDFATLDYKAFE